MENKDLPAVESVAALVHDGWWREKAKQGFHAPVDCDSEAHKRYHSLSAEERKKEFGSDLNEKRYKWCEHCHPNMYPYDELTEAEKELDRATVRSVYDAIDKLK